MMRSSLACYEATKMVRHARRTSIAEVFKGTSDNLAMPAAQGCAACDQARKRLIDGDESEPAPDWSTRKNRLDGGFFGIPFRRSEPAPAPVAYRYGPGPLQTTTPR